VHEDEESMGQLSSIHTLISFCCIVISNEVGLCTKMSGTIDDQFTSIVSFIIPQSNFLS